jgi:O-antigen/teichoic acid export membrane protein
LSVSPYASSNLKRTAVHFLGGKAVSALLTFIALLWIVRLLPVAQYGVYVTLVAALELLVPLASVGLPWMAARYLPEFRLHANGRNLGGFTWRVMALLALTLSATALLLALLGEPVLQLLKMQEYRDMAALYLLVLVAEGLGRNLRENALGPLLQQAVAQVSLVVKNLSLLAILAWLALDTQIQLVHVVAAELASSLLGAMVAWYGLQAYLGRNRDLPGSADWQPPAWQAMRKTALHMYASSTLAMAYSPQTLTFLLQRYAGLEVTAVFGFLRKLYDLVSNYLPATLLFSLVRPKLVAAYTGEGGLSALTGNANLIGKSSLFVLMPVIVSVLAASDFLVALLSGGKFQHHGLYFLGLMLALIPASQRQIMESVAVTVGHSDLCARAALLSLLLLPAALLLFEVGLGIWTPILVLGMSQLLFNLVVLKGLGSRTGYQPDARGFFKLMASTVVAGVLSWQLIPSPMTLTGLVLACLAACTLFLVSAYVIKPFTGDERERINRLIKRRLFVW